MLNHPSEYKPSVVPQEQGRIDIVQVSSEYARNRDDAFKYAQFILVGNDPAKNALAVCEALLRYPRNKLLFVSCDFEQLEQAWTFLQENTHLDTRLGTIGYNGQGLTIYK
jgi:hypothetical protein